MNNRSTVKIDRKQVTKTFSLEETFTHELWFYDIVPWACPKLLDVIPETRSLVIERLPVALNFPSWKPVAAMQDLLEDLFKGYVHHRDVHVKNIVNQNGEPKLIDWETACVFPGPKSYDLYGPEASKVPPPLIHEGMTPQWWGSKEAHSIMNRWIK